MKYTQEQLNIALQEAIKQEINSRTIEMSEYYRKIQQKIMRRIRLETLK